MDINYLLNQDGSYKFDLDMGESNYNKWLYKYPNYIESIFLNLIRYGEKTTCEDIKYFINKGIDINKKIEYKLGLNHILLFSFYYHDVNLFKCFIDNGAIYDRNELLLNIILGSYYEYLDYDIQEKIKVIITSFGNYSLLSFINNTLKYEIEDRKIFYFWKRLLLNYI